MNDEDRNTGVTEARFALTLLTCILVAVGYVVLLRLGGTKDSPVVVGPDDGPPPIMAGSGSTPPVNVEPQPQVLPIDKPDEGPIENMAERPKRSLPPNRPGKTTRR
jgi:hypothetical protein